MAKKKKIKKTKKTKKTTKAKKQAAKKSGKKKAAKKKKAEIKISGPQRVFIGLGSNVGDREEYIEQASFLINKIKGAEVIKRSSNYETEPEGDSEQPNFINAVIEIKTEIPPEKLIDEFNQIENALGREREVEWGPRTIDIDILLYGNAIISSDRLQIPHPLMHERLFVLKPLKEIAPSLVHPALEKTINELYEERVTEGGHTYDNDLPGFKKIKGAIYNDFERW